jgi:hypothetical protein
VAEIRAYLPASFRESGLPQPGRTAAEAGVYSECLRSHSIAPTGACIGEQGALAKLPRQGATVCPALRRGLRSSVEVISPLRIMLWQPHRQHVASLPLDLSSLVRIIAAARDHAGDGKRVRLRR